MSSRAATATAALVLLTLIHLFGVLSSLGSPETIWLWHDAAGWAASLLGVVGTVAAVGAFARGDHLRRAWGLMAAAAALLLCGTALRSYWIHSAPGRDFLESQLIYPRAVVVVAANVFSTWALVLLARTYQDSGLPHQRTAGYWVAWLCVSLLALFLAGRQFGADAAKMGSLRDTFSALTSMASTLGDTATIILIVPILRVAYLLRGGRLAWVWWAVGLSGAVWLAYDVREWICVLLPGDPAQHLELIRVLRTPALALMGLAGFLQREALREPAERSIAAAA